MSKTPTNAAIAVGQDALLYLDAARVLIVTEDKGLTLSHFFKPIYFLMCQSIELAIKSFLLSQGLTLEDVRQQYGHRPNDLRTAAESRGQTFEPIFAEIVDWMHPFHADHTFRYHRVRHVQVPTDRGMYEVVQPEVSRLVRDAEAVVRAHLSS